MARRILLKLRDFFEGFLEGDSIQDAPPMYDDVRDSFKFDINPHYTSRCVMVKRKAIVESLSSDLHSFLEKTNQNLSGPNRKFLRDGLTGLPG